MDVMRLMQGSPAACDCNEGWLEELGSWWRVVCCGRPELGKVPAVPAQSRRWNNSCSASLPHRATARNMPSRDVIRRCNTALCVRCSYRFL